MSNPDQPLALFFLGTWQTYRQRYKTNTAILHDRILLDPENKFLSDGVGSGFPRGLGGAFGYGVRRRVDKAIRWVEKNLSDPSQKVVTFGFSRGATEARWTSGELGQMGINTQYLGVFDTVGSLGVPAGGRWLMAPRFPDCVRGSYVEASCHIVAMDETRKHFQPTLWTNTADVQWHQQVWIPGTHADIGGGNGNYSKNHLCIELMIHHAERHGGIRFEKNIPPKIWTDADFASVTPPRGGIWKLLGNKPRRIPPSAIRLESAVDLRRWLRLVEP